VSLTYFYLYVYTVHLTELRQY